MAFDLRHPYANHTTNPVPDIVHKHVYVYLRVRLQVYTYIVCIDLYCMYMRLSIATSSKNNVC